VVAAGDNETWVLDREGAIITRVPDPLLAAQLSGSDLVVVRRGELRHYSVRAGELQHTWPLPDVTTGRGCAMPNMVRCRPSPRLLLQDLARRLVTYVLDGHVHLLRLADGTDAVVARGTLARYGRGSCRRLASHLVLRTSPVPMTYRTFFIAVLAALVQSSWVRCGSVGLDRIPRNLLFSGLRFPCICQCAVDTRLGAEAPSVSGLLSPADRGPYVRCRTNCLNADAGSRAASTSLARTPGGTGRNGQQSGQRRDVVGPDSRRLAYSGPFSRWVRVVDVRTVRRLQQIDGAWGPLWSPDGARLAVRGAGGLYTVRPDGSDRRRIARAFDPSWSPDGKWLAFEDEDAIYRVSADGKRRRLVVREADLASASSAGVLLPSWSPRGDWIAFVAAPEHPEWGIYLIHPDGTRLRRVLDLGPWGFGTGPPAWSPDGRFLGVTVIVGAYSTSVEFSDAVVIDVSSSRIRRVTQGWRYGSANVVVQWHPRGLSASRLPGVRVPAGLPTDTRYAPTAIRTTRVVDRLAADGRRVAYTFVPPTYAGYFGRRLYRDSELNCAELWEPGSASETSRVVRLREPCSGTPWGPQGAAVAGDRIAWVESILGTIAGSNSNRVYAGTVKWPAPQPLLPESDAPAGDLVGDGELMVFDTWARTGYCIGSACYSGAKRDSRLFRFDGGSAARLITSSAGQLTPLSVDVGRILVDRGDGVLELMSASGGSLRTFQLNAALVRGARLQGRDLVVLTPTAIEVTNAETGASPPLAFAPDARLDVQTALQCSWRNGTSTSVRLSTTAGGDHSGAAAGDVPAIDRAGCSTPSRGARGARRSLMRGIVWAPRRCLFSRAFASQPGHGLLGWGCQAAGDFAREQVVRDA
jgi:hypothetical protein